MNKEVYERYMVFEFYDYAAEGGCSDCEKSFFTMDAAREYAKASDNCEFVRGILR